MSFHEVLFPPEIAYGASGGPKFKTAVFSADSGYEQRTLDWKDVRAEYDVSHTVKNPEQRDALLNFFMARRGMAYGFRFKDWNDYTLRQEVIALGDNVTKTFQVKKRYTSDQGAGESWTYDRKITKLAWGTMAGVTVGGVPAKRCYSEFFFDAGTAIHAYLLDENTGVMTFRDAPDGVLYEGIVTQQAFTLMAGGDLTQVQSATPAAGGIVADWDSGYTFLKGNGTAGTGIRRVVIATGVEDLQRTSVDIGFPDTDGPSSPRDNQRITGIAAAGAGYVYVIVGGSNREVLYKLDQETLSIQASYGIAGGAPPDAGEIGVNINTAVISNDGTRLMLNQLVGGPDATFPIFNIEGTALEYSGYANTFQTEGSSGPKVASTCPLYTSGFACLLNIDGEIQLWDEVGNLLLTKQNRNLGGLLDASGMWCVWDSGSVKGVVFAWKDSEGIYLTKYGVDAQKDVWTVNLPQSASLTYVAGCTRMGDQLCFVAGERLYIVNTITGDIAARECPAGSITQAYDLVTNKIVCYPSTGRIIDTSLAAVGFAQNVEIKIGYAEFHVPVRFDTDHMDMSHDAYNVTSWSGIPLVEVRDWNDLKLATPQFDGAMNPDTVVEGFVWETIVSLPSESDTFASANDACRAQFAFFGLGFNDTAQFGTTVISPDGKTAQCNWTYGEGTGPAPSLAFLVPDETEDPE